MFFYCVCSVSLAGQGLSSVVHLGEGGRLTNAIVYQNAGNKPVSDSCIISFSAVDSAVSGNGNVYLTENPFDRSAENTFHIHVKSAAYNSGTSDLAHLSGELDLDGNPRLSCGKPDMGAFELNLPKTAIVGHSGDVRTLQGAAPAGNLAISASGNDLTYSWQRNNDVLIGESLDTLHLTGEWQDTGVYRAIANGDCGSDTSMQIHVTYDIASVSGGGFCPNGEAWAQVRTSGTIYTYRWDNGETDSIIKGLSAGSHWIDISDTANRSKRLFFTTIAHPPTSDTIFTITVPSNETCDNGAIRLNPDFIDKVGDSVICTFFWTKDGVLYSNERDVSGLASFPSIYKLEITNPNTGCVDVFDFALSCTYKFDPGTTFMSPNGDGINDKLNIKYIERFPKNTVTVLNAYGEVIYSAKNYDNKKVYWNGRNPRGAVVPDGVYTYILEAEGHDVMSGWIVIKITK